MVLVVGSSMLGNNIDISILTHHHQNPTEILIIPYTVTKQANKNTDL